VQTRKWFYLSKTHATDIVHLAILQSLSQNI